MMARAITSAELTKLRSENQMSRLYLAILAPTTVYSCRVNQSTFDDPVAEIAFDGATGTAGNVLPGMTVWVGSSAGAYDLGMCRVRKAISGSTLYIGRDSEIAWADNLYLTVVDDFGLWPRHPAIDTDGITELVDHDIAYSDQHANPDPVPVLGPDAVAWLPTGGTVDVTFDASASWVLGGSITAYLWGTAPGATIDDDTSATPTITFDAAGRYLIDCQVTADNGKSFTGYRYVYVFDDDNPPLTQFTLQDCSGDFDSGSYKARVRMYAEADLATIHDRARAVLFAKDYYAGAESELGPLAGRENVFLAGWIAGESIVWSPNEPEVTFEIQGPTYWLDRMEAFPVGLEDTAAFDNGGGAADRWTEFAGLTMDAYLWHLLHWRSTCTAVIDCTLTGDTGLAEAISSTAGSLREQLRAAELHRLARQLCDRYGRLFIEIDPQFLSSADRAGLPVVMTLLETDWQDPADVERVTVFDTSLVMLSGVAYDGAGNVQAYFSQAPGLIFSRLGKPEPLDNLLLIDQAEADALAGRALGKMRNQFPSLTLTLAQNNRFIDICPRQYCQVDIAAEDTLRGFACTGKRLIPRSVTYSHDPKTGMLSTEVEFEGEADILQSVTVIKDTGSEIPVANTPPALPPLPTWNPYPGPITGSPPPIISPPPSTGANCSADMDAPANGPFPLWVRTVLRSDDPDANAITGWLDCIVRAAAATNKTKLLIDGCFEKSTDGSTWEALPDMAGIQIRTHNYGAGDPNIYYADNSIYTGARCEQRGGFFTPASPTQLNGPGGFDVLIQSGIVTDGSIEHDPDTPPYSTYAGNAYWTGQLAGAAWRPDGVGCFYQWLCSGLPAGDMEITVKNNSHGTCIFQFQNGTTYINSNNPSYDIAPGDSQVFSLARYKPDGALELKMAQDIFAADWSDCADPYACPMAFEITEFKVAGVSVMGIIRLTIYELYVYNICAVGT